MPLAGLAGYGFASSEKNQNLGPRSSMGGTSSTSPAPPASVNGTGSASGIGRVSGGDNTSQGDRLQSQPVGTPHSTTDGVNQSSVSLIADIPDSVAKDLDSPNTRERYRALDHWETKGTQSPLDPVFEALEDDDPAVRANAAAIVEQYVAKQ